MKLLAKNQLIGLGTEGYSVFRNLYETDDGVRVSVNTSRTFDIHRERKLGEKYPPNEILFEKHKLPLL